MKADGFCKAGEAECFADALNISKSKKTAGHG